MVHICARACLGWDRTDNATSQCYRDRKDASRAIKQFLVNWVDSGCEAQCSADPAYPYGKDIASAAEPSRYARLPYPAERPALFKVVCTVYGSTLEERRPRRRSTHRKGCFAHAIARWISDTRDGLLVRLEGGLVIAAGRLHGYGPRRQYLIAHSATTPDKMTPYRTAKAITERWTVSTRCHRANRWRGGHGAHRAPQPLGNPSPLPKFAREGLRNHKSCRWPPHRGGSWPVRVCWLRAGWLCGI